MNSLLKPLKLLLLSLLLATGWAYAADSLRPQIGKPLQAAQELITQYRVKH